MTGGESPTVFTLEAVNAILPKLRSLVEAQMTLRTDIDGRLESDLVVGTVADPVLTQYKYFRAHASPHESLGRQNGEQALTSRDSADRSAELMIPAATERRF